MEWLRRSCVEKVEEFIALRQWRRDEGWMRWMVGDGDGGSWLVDRKEAGGRKVEVGR